jgi:hypothetical protein
LSDIIVLRAPKKHTNFHPRTVHAGHALVDRHVTYNVTPWWRLEFNKVEAKVATVAFQNQL